VVTQHARRAIPLAIVVALVVLLTTMASPVLPGAPDRTDGLTRMIVFAAVALVFSFLCSVAEAVLLSVSPAYLSAHVAKGSRSARMLATAKGEIDRSLAAILTLNTVAHTVGAGGAGAEAAVYFGDRYVGVAMAVLTLLILFLSEIVPKTLGAVYWRRLANPTAWFVRLLVYSLYPFVWTSERITRLITGGKEVHALSREELAAMADLGETHGQLAARESRILRNLFQLEELRVRDVMTPRTVVFSLQESMTVSEALQRHPEPPFSRIPIYGTDRDHMTGFVLKTDILLAELQGRGEEPLSNLARPVRAVGESESLEQVMDEMLDKRDHILLVLDAYGGLDGVVTLEDVVETLIGIEIVDEADTTVDMRQLARQRWRERIQRLGIDPTLLDAALRPSPGDDAED
jgi:CBS domain containing-hemolysin-like protein